MYDCSVGHCPDNNSDIPLWFAAALITAICFLAARYFVDNFPEEDWLAPVAVILGIVLLIAIAFFIKPDLFFKVNPRLKL